MPHPDIDNYFGPCGEATSTCALHPDECDGCRDRTDREKCPECKKACTAQDIQNWGSCFLCWKVGPPEFPGAEDEAICPLCSNTCIQADLFHLGCCGCETNLENERLTCAF